MKTIILMVACLCLFGCMKPIPTYPNYQTMTWHYTPQPPPSPEQMANPKTGSTFGQYHGGNFVNQGVSYPPSQTYTISPGYGYGARGNGYGYGQTITVTPGPVVNSGMTPAGR